LPPRIRSALWGQRTRTAQTMVVDEPLQYAPAGFAQQTHKCALPSHPFGLHQGQTGAKTECSLTPALVMCTVCANRILLWTGRGRRQGMLTAARKMCV